MARGGPDWFDPRATTYGVINLAKESKWANAGVETPLLDVKGRGLFMGGVLYADQGQNADFDVVKFLIDGEEITDATFYILNRYGMDKPAIYPVFIITYDDPFHRYSVGFASGITFGQSFGVIYDNNHANNMNVWVRCFYSLIV